MIRFFSGTSNFDDSKNRFIGWTIEDFVEEAAMQTLLGLNGRESVEVSSDDGNSWESVDSYYEICAGDQIRFGQQKGEKGIV